MENLKNVISYLQTNDKNGSYYEILEEIENGELTIENAKDECIQILSQWQNENLAPTDIEEYNRMQKLIDSITD